MKAKAKILTATIAALLGASALVAGHDSDERSNDRGGRDDGRVGASESVRIRIGFQIAPVPLNTRGKDKALIGLGSYIVNAQGGCNDCHTNPPFAAGGDPHMGQPTVINAARYLAGGTPFGPGLVSANLTPDQYGRPAGLTFPEFKMLMRTGRDSDDPTRILQVMPWPVYAEMASDDLRAVYEYLRAIPSLPDATP
jgi:hypothetical protein